MVRGKGIVLAVSDAYKLAPWADFLVSTDLAWWLHHKPEFDGKRVCGTFFPGALVPPGVPTSLNSAATAVQTVREYCPGVSRIFLLGCDFQGDHFFGKHPAPLKNTTPERWATFEWQFFRQLQACERANIQLINLTPGSLLQCVPKRNIEDLWTIKN